MEGIRQIFGPAVELDWVVLLWLTFIEHAVIRLNMQRIIIMMVIRIWCYLANNNYLLLIRYFGADFSRKYRVC